MSRLYSTFTNIREYITPVATGASTFRETGQITIEEFVEAGDYLVNKFPTWSWLVPLLLQRRLKSRESGPASRRKDFLPAEKQYLATRRVPCRYRPKELERQAANADEQLVDEGDEEWVATHTDRARQTNIVNAAHIPDIDMDVDADEEMRDMDIDDIPGLDDMQMPSDDDSDNDTTNDMNRTVRTRTYDLFITYDKYWRCPRLWLFGYTALGAPLPVTAIMEDISTDYVDKTVTMETWPYMEGQCMSMASVHPCKHSAVMQSIIARQSERGDEVRVDQYLIIFLKFMGSVIPTIEHDNTMGF